MESNQPHILGVDTIAESSWLSLQKIHYKDMKGINHAWERCIRTSATRRSELGILEKTQIKTHTNTVSNSLVPSEASIAPKSFPDAAAVMGLVYQSSQRLSNNALEPGDLEVILVKQFRPPLCAYSLEFPAGLIDPGETPIEAGLRELKEETGYVATKVLHVSPLMSLSPGTGTESSVLVIALVDLDAPENQNICQTLEEGEEIEVIKIPLKYLTAELQKASQSGIVVFSEVYCIAMGVTMLHTLIATSLN